MITANYTAMDKKFNQSLIKNIPAQYQGIAKLILFTINERLNLINFIDDVYHDQVMKVTNMLVDNGIIGYDPITGLHTITQSLYVEKNIELLNVDEFRKYFFKEYCGVPGKIGDKRIVATLLQAWIENTGLTYEIACNIAKIYVDYWKSKGIPENISRADRFIYDDNTDQSRLYQWYESNEGKTGWDDTRDTL